MNDILMACEQEGQLAQYYQELIELTSEQTIKSILQIAEHVHEKHANTLRNINNKIPTVMRPSRILIHGSALIQKLQQKYYFSPMDTCHTDQYQALQGVELQLEQFYTHKAQQTDIPFNKDLFKKLARDKHKLYTLMNHLCETIKSNDVNLDKIEFNPKIISCKNFAS